MAEQLVNEFTVNRPIDEAWAVITDVERIAPACRAPNCKRSRATSTAVSSRSSSARSRRSSRARPRSSIATTRATGRCSKPRAGTPAGGGTPPPRSPRKAESLSPTSTRCVVTTDLHITGRVAQFGRGILGDVSKKLMAQFASNLNTMLDDQGAERRPPATATAPTPLPPPMRPRRRRPARRRRRRRPPEPPTCRLPAPTSRDRSRGSARSRARPPNPSTSPGSPARRSSSASRRCSSAVVRRSSSCSGDAARTTGGVRRCQSPRPWTTDDNVSPSCSAAVPPAATPSSSAADAGDPVVIRNAPLLDDGTPMPTRYWLVGRDEVVAVEPAGGCRRRRRRRGSRRRRRTGRRPCSLRRRTRRRRSARHADHRPTGGVGGTRQGVKCLHAHYAWHLAGGDDPVGTVGRRAAVDRRWRRHRRRRSVSSTVQVGPTLPDVDRRTARRARRRRSADAAVAHQRHRRGHRRHRQPAARAAGDRRAPHPRAHRRRRRGTSPSSSAGAPPDPAVARLTVDRDDLEDLFRTLATERRRRPPAQPGAASRSASTRSWRPAVPCWRSCAGCSSRGAVAIRPASGGALMRHPSGRPTIPSPLRLYGSRVMLRPLVAQDFAPGGRSGSATRRGSLPWEPRRPLPQFDPSRQPRSVRVALLRPRARRGRRASRSGSGCSSTTGCAARSTSTTCCAARCKPGRSATGSTSGTPGAASSPRASSSSSSSPSNDCGCIAWRSTSCRATPTVAGSWRSSTSASEGVAVRMLEINGDVGGPRALRDHRRGVAGTGRRAPPALAAPRPERCRADGART